MVYISSADSCGLPGRGWGCIGRQGRAYRRGFSAKRKRANPRGSALSLVRGCFRSRVLVGALLLYHNFGLLSTPFCGFSLLANCRAAFLRPPRCAPALGRAGGGAAAVPLLRLAGSPPKKALDNVPGVVYDWVVGSISLNANLAKYREAKLITAFDKNTLPCKSYTLCIQTQMLQKRKLCEIYDVSFLIQYASTISIIYKI